MQQEIYVIDNTDKIREILQKLLDHEMEYKYEIKIVKPDWIEVALKNIPELIIINDDAIETKASEYCKLIRENEDNSITPIIVISSNTDMEYKLETLENSVEYFLPKPIDEDILYHTVKNIIRLMHMNRTVSPLTGLPGNVQIQAELKKRILTKENFSVLYFDLDNFKAYNDVYGFLKGDEVIQYTAATILRHVHNGGNKNFVGHIGGDDFVAIIEGFNWESICQDIIIEFDEGILKLLTEQDVKRGYLESVNRKGIIEQFPITGISIGIVESRGLKTDNILEIGEIGAQVKHAAKNIMGSCYISNQRI